MEKLEPVLRHKFWILVGVALLVPLIGWWMATGTIQAEIADREGKVNQAFQSVESLQSGEIPNEDWKANLDKINAVQKQRNNIAVSYLWDYQQQFMTWPANLVPYVEQVGYRGNFASIQRETYRNSYLIEVDKVWRAANPYDPETNEGLVHFPLESLPRRDFQRGPPSSEQMWDAQEDLWLYKALLETVSRVNQDATNRLEAPIKAIDTIQLMGGTRTVTPTGGGGGQGGGASGTMEDLYAAGGQAGGFGGSGEQGMGGMGGGGSAASADFNPSEEFGSSQGAGGGMDYAAAMSVGSAEATGGPTGGAAAAPAETRYVDKDDSQPYQKRGFYISLVMDHTKIPDLLAEFTACPWPVEVVRVQWVLLRQDEITGGQGTIGPVRTNRGTGRTAAGPRGSFGRRGAGQASYEEQFSGPNMGNMGAGGEGYNYDGGGGGGFNSSDPAMQDPSLAKVAIAGLMTLYKPVTIDPSTGEVVVEAPAEETPAEEAPADGTAVDEAASPEAPVTPTEAEPLDEGAPPADAVPAVSEPSVEEVPAESGAAETPDDESAVPEEDGTAEEEPGTGSGSG